MDIRPYSRRQLKHLEAGTALWSARSSLLANEAELSGGMHWKPVRDRQYLVRYWTDGTTGAKRSKSLGVRSETTEKLYADFADARARSAKLSETLNPKLSEWSSAAASLDLARLSPATTSLYREFQRSGHGDVLLVDRDAWLAHSVFLGSELVGVRAMDPFDLGGNAVVVMVPDHVDREAVSAAILRSHRGLEQSKQVFVGNDGTTVFAMMLQASHLVGWAMDNSGEQKGRALMHCLAGSPARAVLPDADGLPMSVSTMQPAASVLMAWISQDLPHARRPDVVRDYAIGMAEALVEREDPLIEAVIDAVPDLALELQAGGRDGFRI